MSPIMIVYVCVRSSSHVIFNVNGATNEVTPFVNADEVGVGIQAMSRLIANRTNFGIIKLVVVNLWFHLQNATYLLFLCDSKLFELSNEIILLLSRNR